MGQASRLLYESGSAEIVEKKSRFIAATAPVDSEEEALAFIEKIKKEHWNARHNCYAYVIGERHQLQRFSDDGEPSQTAGKPILDVLLGEDVHNAIIVVTRYFGGILLGTGGLVRAYSKAAQEGLAASRIVEKQQGVLWEIETDYNGIGRITYQLAVRQVPVLSTAYTDKVKLRAIIPLEEEHALRKALADATSGQVRIVEEGTVWFAIPDGKPVLL